MRNPFRKTPEEPPPQVIKRDSGGRLQKGTAPLPGAGRPRIPKAGKNMAEKFRRALEEAATEEDAYTRLDEIIDIAIEKARGGEYQFIEYVLARAYGKLMDRVQVQTEPDYDLDALSDEDLEALERIRTKLSEKDSD